MTIRVIPGASLREIAGVPHIEVECEPGNQCTVVDIIHRAAMRGTPEFLDRVLTPDGSIRRSLLVFVDERPVLHDDIKSHAVRDGADVLLFPPVSGG